MSTSGKPTSIHGCITNSCITELFDFIQAISLDLKVTGWVPLLSAMHPIEEYNTDNGPKFGMYADELKSARDLYVAEVDNFVFGIALGALPVEQLENRAFGTIRNGSFLDIHLLPALGKDFEPQGGVRKFKATLFVPG